MAVILALMADIDAGWKRDKSFRSVMRSVLDGGDGCERGGRFERSSDNWGCSDEERDARFAPKDEAEGVD